RVLHSLGDDLRAGPQLAIVREFHQRAASRQFHLHSFAPAGACSPAITAGGGQEDESPVLWSSTVVAGRPFGPGRPEHGALWKGLCRLSHHASTPPIE